MHHAFLYIFFAIPAQLRREMARFYVHLRTGIPKVPEAFPARFPLSVKSLKVAHAKSFAAHVFSLRPTKRSSPTHARKKPQVPSVERERQGYKF